MPDLLSPSHQVPVWRLRIALAAIVVNSMLRGMPQLDGWGEWVGLCVGVPLAIFMNYFGIFRVPNFQLFWGWLFLALVLVVAISVASTLVWKGHLPERAPPVRMIVELAIALLGGYLLVFDRHIREYRRALRARASS